MTNLTHDTLPGILVSLPWGTIADRRGRRLVAFLGVIGEVLVAGWIAAVCMSSLHYVDIMIEDTKTVTAYFSESINPRMTLVSSIFYIIGGGNGMILAMVIATIVQPVSEVMRFWFLFEKFKPHE